MNAGRQGAPLRLAARSRSDLLVGVVLVVTFVVLALGLWREAGAGRPMSIVDEHTERAKQRIKEEGEDGTNRMRIYLDAVPLEFGAEPDAGTSE